MKKLFNIFIIIVIGAVLITVGQRTLEIRSWPDIEAVITSHEVGTYRESETYLTGDGTSRTKWVDKFKIDFYYSYEIDDLKYTGRFIVDDIEWEREIKPKLALYPEGKNIIIKYDPEIPEDSVFRD